MQDDSVYHCAIRGRESQQKKVRQTLSTTVPSVAESLQSQVRASRPTTVPSVAESRCRIKLGRVDRFSNVLGTCEAFAETSYSSRDARDIIISKLSSLCSDVGVYCGQNSVIQRYQCSMQNKYHGDDDGDNDDDEDKGDDDDNDEEDNDEEEEEGQA
ncbi:hypothetical protein PoB_000584000 [Plakobranchus ocellatus]|uniref:Uncharacterized protein n=1 Tax=Plakobranchus ocellatus TaxID=259542 RepID=A0AAV3Y960_9GAST|nr:hypothetical protein PoB_000584000 [Plakobranchus ocellatus]